MLVDKTYRCDALEAGFEDVCQRLNLKISPLPRINIAPKVDWRAYYSDDLATRVHNYWQTEIEYFGFTFDTPQEQHRQHKIFP